MRVGLLELLLKLGNLGGVTGSSMRQFLLCVPESGLHDKDSLSSDA